MEKGKWQNRDKCFIITGNLIPTSLYYEQSIYHGDCSTAEAYVDNIISTSHPFPFFATFK